MIHLRLVVPGSLTSDVLAYLTSLKTITDLIVLPKAAVVPPGDLITLDVARESAGEVLDGLAGIGLTENRDDCSIAIEESETMPSRGARRAERAAPGSPDDGIVWPVVLTRAAEDVRGSWSFHAFLCLATTIAAVAVVTDSSILVVGAMVVGPEFGPVAALAVGLALRRWRLAGDAVRLLAIGFGVAVLVSAALALAARGAGWIEPATLLSPRPLTSYIWRPDRWSFVVALLAGAAGVLSLTAGRTNVLVGVFISVTTVPAAGNLALALALWVPSEIGGSALQLAVNLGGMTVAGWALLTVQRLITTRRGTPADARGTAAAGRR